jgi:hypothetical protein
MAVMMFHVRFLYPSIDDDDENRHAHFDVDTTSSRRPSPTNSARTSSSIPSDKSSIHDCHCERPRDIQITDFRSASGQDKFIPETLYQQDYKCCQGVFVEFGARDGIQDSNTFVFEQKLGWKGLLFEMNPNGE